MPTGRPEKWKREEWGELVPFHTNIPEKAKIVLDNLAKKLGGRPDALVALTSRKDEIEAFFEEKLNQLNQKLKQLEEENFNLKTQIEDLKGENGILKQKLNEAESKLTNESVEKLKEEIQYLKGLKERLKQKQRELFLENQELRKKLEQYEGKKQTPNFAYGDPNLSNLKSLEVSSDG